MLVLTRTNTRASAIENNFNKTEDRARLPLFANRERVHQRYKEFAELLVNGARRRAARNGRKVAS